MTRITRIRTEGLRSTDRELDLTPLTLLRGPVGAGKTSVADAVRVGLQGCVPSIGRAASATARIMRDRYMRVTIDFDDGRSLEHGYKREGESLRAFASASWLDPKTNLTDTQEAIRGLVGTDDREAAENLDLRELLNASPQERARRIEALLDASGIPVDDLVRRAAAMTTMRLSGVDLEKMPEDLDKAERAAAGSRELLEDVDTDVLDAVSEQVGQHVRSGGLAFAIGKARDEKNEAAERVRRQIAARAELEDRESSLEAPAVALSDVEARREAAVERKSAASKDLESASQVAEARREVEPAIPLLQKKVEAARANLESALARLPEAAAAEQQAAVLPDPAPVDAPPVVQPDAEQVARAEALAARATQLSAEADAIEVPEPISVDVERARFQDAVDAYERAEESPWREVEALADAFEAAVVAADHDTDGPARLRQLAADHGGSLDALREARNAAHGALREASERREAREAEIALAKGRRTQLRTESREASEEAGQIRNAAQAAADAANRISRSAYAEAVGDREVALDAVKQERKALRDKAKEIRDAVPDAQATLSEAESNLRAAQERLQGIGVVKVDEEEARAALEQAKAEIAECDAQLEVLRGADSLQKEMRTLLRQIDAATAEQKVWKAAEWALQRLREADLHARAGGLQERMRTYLRAAGRPEDPYLRAGRGVCDFGWRRGGREISVEALSGGETALFCAALAGAVIALRAPQLRILLVEAAEIGNGPEAQQLLAACQAMVEAGDLDQVLVATCLNIPAPDGWNVVDLEAAVEAEVAA